MDSRRVELKQLSGKNLATGITQYYEVWLVYVIDGEDQWLAGRLDWSEGSELAYLRAVDPYTKKWINDEVSKQTDREVESVDFPELSEVLSELDRDKINEFDEEDITG